MSDSSDDEPILQKLAMESGERRSKAPVSYAESDDSDDDQPTLARLDSKPKGASGRSTEEDKKPSSKPEGGSKKRPPSSAKASADAKAKGGNETKATPAKKPRKQYDLPGQTRDTPDETDPLRKFYSTLREQRPDSAMAAKWLCQHGLLEQAEAEEWVAQNQKGAVSLALCTVEPCRKNGTDASEVDVNSSGDPTRRPHGASCCFRDPRTKSPAAKKGPSKPRRTSAPQMARSQGTARKVARETPVRRKSGKDVAFEDGGLDVSDENSDSDDDKPLALRK